MSIQHRIQERQFSANVIERGIWTGNDKSGKPLYSWHVLLVPVIQPGDGSFFEKKKAIDSETQDLLVYYNTFLEIKLAF